MLRTVLLGILAMATLALVLMGLAQWRRRRALAGVAQEMGLNFAPHDPFDVPRRCACLRLMQGGHSAYAANVMFGRVGDVYLRAFDYRFELGHGVQRLSRWYSVIAADAECPLPDVLAWRGRGAQPVSLVAPPAGASPDGGWHGLGPREMAGRLRRGWDAPDEGPRDAADDGPVCIEARDGLVVFASPQRLTAPELARYVRRAARCLGSLCPGDRPAPGGSDA